MHTYTPPKDSGISPSTHPSPVSWEPIMLDVSNDILKRGEFWVPIGFDGFEAWKTEACAPHWIESRAARTRWCNKHCRETTWPDHGETSDDPTKFINFELAGLLCDLKGSSDIPKRHQKRLQEKLQDLGVIGAEYLAEAIELVLKVGGAPPHQQITKENLLDHKPISSYLNKDVTRILELAFRAGRVEATRSAYYRGGPFMAQDGAPTALELGKGRPEIEKQKKKPKLKRWQETASPKLKENEDFDRLDLLKFLIQERAIHEDPPGVYREAETAAGGTTFNYESFRRKVSRFISRKKKRTV